MYTLWPALWWLVLNGHNNWILASSHLPIVSDHLFSNVCLSDSEEEKIRVGELVLQRCWGLLVDQAHVRWRATQTSFENDFEVSGFAKPTQMETAWCAPRSQFGFRSVFVWSPVRTVWSKDRLKVNSKSEVHSMTTWSNCSAPGI